MTNEATDPDAIPLPGLEDPPRIQGVAERGVRKQLAAMWRDGSITERTAANAAVALVMAQVVDKKHTMPKPSSTISNDARMVLEALAPAAEAGAQLDDEVRTVMAQWAEEIAAEAARMREHYGLADAPD